MKKSLPAFFLLAILFTFTSCKKDDSPQPDPNHPPANYHKLTWQSQGIGSLKIYLKGAFLDSSLNKSSPVKMFNGDTLEFSGHLSTHNTGTLHFNNAIFSGIPYRWFNITDSLFKGKFVISY